MKLREMYHNGENSIPPVFLIENPSPSQSKIWEETFSGLSQYFCHAQKLRLTRPVQNYPWEEPTTEVYEGEYVLSEEEELVMEGQQIKFKKLENLATIEQIDVVKQWVSRLQLDSLKKEVKQKAQAALELAQYLRDAEIKVQKEIHQKQTFHDRVVKRQKHDYDADLAQLIKELKNLSQDNILTNLSEVEAAKRLAIGTKVGKYHQQAMKIKGISVQDYVVARDNFVALFDKCKLSPESSQLPSIITLQNQKDVFLEPDFVTGLKMCTNQYDLVETLPLIGQAIKIKRIDGSMINPYLITVEDMPRHHQVIDTLSLLSNQWELKLSKGNNEFEVVNAVLPLFDEKDQDLKPFITSKIYSILMTFNVMQNADTCFENSYLALLSNTLMYLMTQNDSEWRNELIDKVFKTIQITYSKSKGFQKYCEQLLTNPRIAVVTEHPDLENKCEDLSKALLMFFYLVRDGKITEESQKVEILNAIFADIYGRFYPSDQIINLFFSLNNKDILKTIDFTPYIQQVKAKFPNLIKYYTPFELKGEITKEVMALDLKLNIDFEVEINLDKLWFVKEGKFSIDAQKKIYSFFLPGKEVDPRMQWVWIYHASLFRNSYERNKTDMVTDYKAVYDKIKQLKQTEILQDNPIFELVWKDLFEQYKMIMIDLHQQQYILPMNQNVLQQICTQKALKIENYKFNSVSNLLKNACMSTKCPFYMVPNGQLAQHLEGHVARVPAFHKTIKLFPNDDPEFIYQKIIKGEALVWDNPHFSPTNLFTEYSKKALVEQKEKFIEAIKVLQKQYQVI